MYSIAITLFFSNDLIRFVRSKRDLIIETEKKGHRNLGYAGRAVPVSLWDTGDLGFVTVSVAAFITAITQQEQVLVIPLLAHLTVLKNTEEPPLKSRLQSLNRN